MEKYFIKIRSGVSGRQNASFYQHGHEQQQSVSIGTVMDSSSQFISARSWTAQSVSISTVMDSSKQFLYQEPAATA
jgi:hypothetical protein